MFKNSNDFSLHIEQIKINHEFKTYIEAMVYFYENETDHDFEEIVKLLNKKLVAEIQVEAESMGMMKENNAIRIF